MEEEVDYDYMSALIDEIALEGLDGITLPSLWKRIIKRPKFPFPIDMDSKSFLWDCIAPDINLEFFELAETRVPLLIFNRYQNMDMEFGIVEEHEEEIPDPYPYCPVEDKHVKGSCSTFKTRTNVTHLVRELNNGVTTILMTLQDVMQKWAREQLVIVASQSRRDLALLGSDISPSTSFGLIQYCLLERIARSRHHGEVTCGKNSLACLKLPPKTLFYYRKRLLAHKIVVKQFHYQKSKEGQLVKGSLLQLARFYVERLSKMEVLIIKMCKALEAKPDKQEEYGKLRDELELKPPMFKKMFGKIFQTCVRIKVVPASSVYPDRPKEEHFTNNGKERLIKIVELVKPYDDHEEDDVEDEDDKVVEDDKQIHFSPSKLYVDRPLLCQALKAIDNAGPDGATSVMIGQTMGLPKLEIRTLLRVLEKKGVVITVMQDSGRQRSLQYISKRFEDESKAHKQVLEMQQKLQNFTADVDEHMDLTTIMENAGFSDDLQNMGHLDVSVEAIQEEGPQKPSKSWSFSLKDINNINKKLNVPSFTYRMLKRANRIIELVKEYKLFDQLYKIQKKIIDEETEEGVVEKFDRASTSRIIHRLAKDGYIQSIKTILTFGTTTRKMHFICDRSVTPNDPLIKRAIDEAKLRYFSNLGTSDPSPKPKEGKNDDKENESLLVLSKPESEIKFEYCPSVGKMYGFQPKCARMKALHELLCYLTYFYEGDPNNTPCPEIGKQKVYLECPDWRRYLPPIPKRPELKEGFIYFADLMHSLPLSLLVNIVNYSYKITGLEGFLQDKEKCHYLIQHFPADVRNGLLYHRKYVHSIHEIMVKLSFNGLVTFVTQRMKEKEKSLIYVHRKTCLKDTSSSSPNYLHVSLKEYTQINYEFKSMDEVHSYWIDTERISLHTPLGSFANARNQTITVLNIFHKPEMENVLKPKEIEEIVDDYQVPGDGLGAAGFDSAMYFHLKRNWSWPSMVVRTNRAVPKKKLLPCNIVGTSYISYLNSNEEAAQTSAGRKRLGKFLKKQASTPTTTQGVDKENNEEITGENEASKQEKTVNPKKRKFLSETGGVDAGAKKRKIKPVVRVIRKKSAKARKPYYDETDKIALNKMTNMRVSWTAEEDSFLLLCKVASCFLDPYNKMVVPYSIVRDFIHQRMPHLSLNKSSKACQRRILYMLKNPLTVTNVSVYLGEANQDPELAKQFQGPKPNKNQEVAWKAMFSEVLNHLLKKFTTKTVETTLKIILPDTIEDFKKKFDISESGSLTCKKNIHLTPKNTIDIHCSVVYSVVLQSLSSVGDKTNWSLTLYKIYQYYPDTLLRSVIAKLKHEGIITKRKDVAKKMEMSIPFSALPHRLSSKYEFILQGKYHEDIFHSSYRFFKNYVASFRKSEAFSLPHNIDGSNTAILAMLLATQKLEISITIPEQIILFDSKVTEEFKKKLKDKNVTAEKDKTAGQETDETTKSCIEAPLSSRASRFALYMMRHDLSEPLQEFQNVQHAHDSFLINSCKLSASLLHDMDDVSNFSDQSILHLDTKNIRNIITSQRSLITAKNFEIFSQPDIQKHYDNNGYSQKDSLIGWEIYSIILSKKEIGCTLSDLLSLNIYGNSELTLFDHLNTLINKDTILKVGVMQPHYVAMAHASPWILNSVKIPKDSKGMTSEIVSSLKQGAIIDGVLRDEKLETVEPLREGLDQDKSRNDQNSEPSAKRHRVNEDEDKLIPSWFDDAILNKVAMIDENIPLLEDQTSEIKPNQEVEFDQLSDKMEIPILQPAVDVQVDCNVPGDIESTLQPAVDIQVDCNVPGDIESTLQPAVDVQVDCNVPGDMEISTLQPAVDVQVDCNVPGHIEIPILQPAVGVQVDCNVPGDMEISTLQPEVDVQVDCNVPDDMEISNLLSTKAEPQLEEDSSPNITNIVESEVLKWLEENVLNHFQASVESVPQPTQETNSVEDNTENQCVLTEYTTTDEVEDIPSSNDIPEVDSGQVKNVPQEHISLKSWLEAKVIQEVEALHQTANKSASGSSSVAEINRWLQESIVKKLEDKCSVEDIKVWFQKCILEKVENQSAVMDLQQWFQVSILKTLEDQTFLEDMEIIRQAEIDRLASIEQESVALLVSESEIEQQANESTSGQQILEDDQAQEVAANPIESMDTQTSPEPSDKPDLEDLTLWFKTNIMGKVEDKISLEELNTWFQNVILEKVVNENLASDLKEWFENSLLGKIEEKIEADEFKHWFEERFSIICSLQKLQKDVDDSKASRNDLKEWFENTLLQRVESQEIKREVSEWFDSKVLTTVEALNKLISTTDYQDRHLPMTELKKWLNTKVLSRISDAEDIKLLLEETILPEVEQATDLRKWFEEEVLSIVEMNAEVTNSENVVMEISDLSQWFETKVLNKIEEIRDTSDLRTWIQENVLSMIESLIDVEKTPECVVSVVSCLTDIISKIESMEKTKPDKKLELINVVCCVREIITKVEDAEFKCLKKEDLKKWFEEKIQSELEKQTNQEDQRVIKELLVTEVVNKIVEAENVENAKSTSRKRRRKSLSTSSSDIKTSCGFQYEPIKYLSRVWKKPDGTVNRPVLRKMLTSLLSYIMINPGIRENKIFEKFEMCLQPVQILDLLDILKAIDCVDSFYLKTSCKPGLFNSSVVYSFSQTSNVRDLHQTDANTYYEATVYAILKLGKFIDELIMSR